MSVERTTTWGDCPDSDCPQYGRLKYGIEPEDECSDCGSILRWWDRWHDGKHGAYGYKPGIDACLRERAAVVDTYI